MRDGHDPSEGERQPNRLLVLAVVPVYLAWTTARAILSRLAAAVAAAVGRLAAFATVLGRAARRVLRAVADAVGTVILRLARSFDRLIRAVIVPALRLLSEPLRRLGSAIRRFVRIAGDVARVVVDLLTVLVRLIVERAVAPIVRAIGPSLRLGIETIARGTAWLAGRSIVLLAYAALALTAVGEAAYAVSAPVIDGAAAVAVAAARMTGLLVRSAIARFAGALRAAGRLVRRMTALVTRPLVIVIGAAATVGRTLARAVRRWLGPLGAALARALRTASARTRTAVEAARAAMRAARDRVRSAFGLPRSSPSPPSSPPLRPPPHTYMAAPPSGEMPRDAAFVVDRLVPSSGASASASTAGPTARAAPGHRRGRIGVAAVSFATILLAAGLILEVASIPGATDDLVAFVAASVLAGFVVGPGDGLDAAIGLMLGAALLVAVGSAVDAATGTQPANPVYWLWLSYLLVAGVPFAVGRRLRRRGAPRAAAT